MNSFSAVCTGILLVQIIKTSWKLFVQILPKLFTFQTFLLAKIQIFSTNVKDSVKKIQFLVHVEYFFKFFSLADSLGTNH